MQNRSIQCSWIRRLYNNYFHEWKLKPLHLITMPFGSKFKFHSNIFLRKTSLKKLLSFYGDVTVNWKTNFSSSPETPGYLLSQFVWLNKHIKIEENPVRLKNLQLKILIFYLNLLKELV